MQVPRRQVPKPTPDLIAHHCLANRAAHHETHPSWLIDASPGAQVTNEQRPADPDATLDRGSEVVAPPHPRGCGQHRTSPSG